MSVYSDILRAVKSTVEALPAAAGYTVKIRKRIAFFKNHDDLPIIVIAPDVERVADYTMPNGIHLDYPCLVGIIDENDMLLEVFEPTLEARQAIRRALMVTTFDSASEVFDISSYDPSPPFPPGALDQAMDVSLQRFTYRAAEVRTE